MYWIAANPWTQTLILALMACLSLSPSQDVNGQAGGSQTEVAVASDLAWSQDGTQLAVARVDGTLEIVSRTGQLIATQSVAINPLISVTWNPVKSNQLAFSSLHYDVVQVLNVTGSQYDVVCEFPTGQNYVRQVAWSPDGNLLATIGEAEERTGTVSEAEIWDTQSGNLLATYGDGYSLTDMAWNPQNPTQLLITGVADYEGAEMLLWDVNLDTVLWDIQEANSVVLHVVWGPDGSQFASATNPIAGPIVRIHDPLTGAATVTLPMGIPYVGNIAWHPGPNLAISDSGVIQIWDTSAIQIINTLQTTSFAEAISWSPLNELAYSQEGGAVEIAPGLVSTPTPTPTSTETPAATARPIDSEQ